MCYDMECGITKLQKSISTPKYNLVTDDFRQQEHRNMMSYERNFLDDVEFYTYLNDLIRSLKRIKGNGATKEQLLYNIRVI
jgi:hypothetical protein